jgi:hypothetical protein
MKKKPFGKKSRKAFLLTYASYLRLIFLSYVQVRFFEIALDRLNSLQTIATMLQQKM